MLAPTFSGEAFSAEPNSTEPENIPNKNPGQEPTKEESTNELLEIKNFEYIKAYDPADLPRTNWKTFLSDEQALTISTSNTHSYTARIKPWSSWWYPTNSSYLREKLQKKTIFSNKFAEPVGSPLLKFDRWIKKTSGKDSDSYNFYLNELRQETSLPWEGLCASRAYASVYEEEPDKSALVDGVCFTAEDLKYLLISTYEGVSGDEWEGFYGQRFTGHSDDDISDIHPRQFHASILHQLRDAEMPLIIDSDPSLPIWSEVIYSAHSRIVPDISDPTKVSVTTVVKMPIYDLSPQQRNLSRFGAVSGGTTTRTYTYDLFGLMEEDGTFHAWGGVWSGKSIQDHPDFIITLTKDLDLIQELRQSPNRYVTVADVDSLLLDARMAPECRGF